MAKDCLSRLLANRVWAILCITNNRDMTENEGDRDTEGLARLKEGTLSHWIALDFKF